MKDKDKDYAETLSFSAPGSIVRRLESLARSITGGNMSKLVRLAISDFLKALDGE